MKLVTRALTALCAAFAVAPFCAVATASAASAATSAPAVTAAATTRSLACTQTTPTRNIYRRSVSGTVDGTNNLLSATVIRVATGKTDISSNSPTLNNAFLNGYFLTTYAENTWLIGTVGTGVSSATYYLMLPDTTLPTGTAFNAHIYINFDNGLYGHNQFVMSCTAT